MKILLFMSLITTNLIASAAITAPQGCPVIISVPDIRPRLEDTDRRRLKLFSLSRQPTLAWQQETLQIDWRDNEGHVLLPDAESERLRLLYEEARTRGFSDNDRLILSNQIWGEQFTKGDPLPCVTERIHEIAKPEGLGYAYLAFCPPEPATKFESPMRGDGFKFEPAKRSVQTPGYQFQYSKSNHILFDRILVEGMEVGKSANLRIRSDVKRFFTLNFNSEDVESKIVSHRVAELGFLANLSFYLRILFFKIDLELNTGMSFFANAVHIPMILHMPVVAHEWLHPASGSFYSWEVDPKVVKLTTDGKDLPLLEAKQVKKGWEALAKTGLSFCKGPVCSYWLRGTFGSHDFAMHYRIPKRLVKRGFFPLLSTDTQQSEVDLGWQDEGDTEAKQTRIGIYFESSGLGEGEHEWEFWIQLGKLDPADECPAVGRVERVYGL